MTIKTVEYQPKPPPKALLQAAEGGLRYAAVGASTNTVYAVFSQKEKAKTFVEDANGSFYLLDLQTGTAS